MTKFEIVAEIEAKIRIATVGLWRADKRTLEAINAAIPSRPVRNLEAN